MIDVLGQINETHCEPASGRTQAGGARSWVIRQIYDAPVEDAGDTCADPERAHVFYTQTPDSVDGDAGRN